MSTFHWKTSLATPREEMWEQHWQLAAVVPIPSLLALGAGWREGKRFNTKALGPARAGEESPERAPKFLSFWGVILHVDCFLGCINMYNLYNTIYIYI